MDDLYQIKKKKTEMFTYRVRQGVIYSDTSCDARDEISIVFVDEVFDKVIIPFEMKWLRTDWEILALIAGKITNIEKGYKDAKHQPEV
jgi:hypothetical protein